MTIRAAAIIATIWLAIMAWGIHQTSIDMVGEKAYDDCALQRLFDMRLHQPVRHCAAGPAYGEDAL